MGDELFCGGDGAVAVVVDGADDELGAVDGVESSAGFAGARFQELHCAIVVGRGHAIVQETAISDFSGELEHLVASGADENRHVARLAAAMYDVELDA